MSRAGGIGSQGRGHSRCPGNPVSTRRRGRAVPPRRRPDLTGEHERPLLSVTSALHRPGPARPRPAALAARLAALATEVDGRGGQDDAGLAAWLARKQGMAVAGASAPVRRKAAVRGAGAGPAARPGRRSPRPGEPHSAAAALRPGGGRGRGGARGVRRRRASAGWRVGDAGAPAGPDREGDRAAHRAIGGDGAGPGGGLVEGRPGRADRGSRTRRGHRGTAGHGARRPGGHVVTASAGRSLPGQSDGPA